MAVYDAQLQNTARNTRQYTDLDLFFGKKNEKDCLVFCIFINLSKMPSFSFYQATTNTNFVLYTRHLFGLFMTYVMRYWIYEKYF